MANFVALTPPLGHQAFGAFGNFQLPFFTQHQGLPLQFGVSPLEINYPPLSAPIRVLILKQYPGTILPNSDLENVIPRIVPDPVHVQEIQDKYDEVTCDPQIYNDLPTNNVRKYIEREVAEWVFEYECGERAAKRTAKRASYIAVVDQTIMNKFDDLMSKKATDKDGVKNPTSIKPINSKSKKRAREDDDSAEKSELQSHKKSKNRSSRPRPTRPETILGTASMKSQYDAAFPFEIVVEKDSPAYIMAFNYIKEYAKSCEKYAGQINRIIENNHTELLTQRCAKFFAWGLKQSIHAVKVESAEPVSEPESEPVVTKAVAEPELEDEEEVENSDYEELDLGGDSDDEVLTFRPRNQKPIIEKVQKSALSERLGMFVKEMEVANKDLADRSMEVDNSDDEHIEFNLGLGVLEEVRKEELITESK